MAPPPPLTDEERKLAEQPSQEDIIQLMRDDCLRNYRVDIETDSTIEADHQQEKQDRNEFLTAVGGFLAQSLPLAQQDPMIVPLLGEMLMFVVHGYRTGHQLEDMVQQTVDDMTEAAKAKAAAPPPVDPMVQIEQDKLKMAQQGQQGELNLKTKEMDQNLLLAKQKHDSDLMLAKQKSDDDAHKTKTDASIAIAKHNMEMLPQPDEDGEVAEGDEGKPNRAFDAIGTLMQGMMQVVQMMAMSQQQNMQGQQALGEAMLQNTQALKDVARVLAAPKRAIRDANGKIDTMVPMLPPPEEQSIH